MTASRGAWLACGVAGLIAGLWWAIGGSKRSDTGGRNGAGWVCWWPDW